jgi:hypothetical protein
MHKPMVFVSYAREDAAAAERLSGDLRSMNVDPWLDLERLRPGQHWAQEIDSAMRNSDYIALLLSSRSITKRGYIQKEMRKALDLLDEVPDSQVFLIPIRLDECQPAHDRLKMLQWVDLYPQWQAGIDRLRSVFLFAPEDTHDVPTIDLVGSFWVAFDSDSGEWKFQFMPGGHLRYEDAAIDRYHTNGRWRQVGNVVYVELNDKYVQLRGTVEQGQITSGEGQSVTGRRFGWVARREWRQPTWKPFPDQVAGGT